MMRTTSRQAPHIHHPHSLTMAMLVWIICVTQSFNTAVAAPALAAEVATDGQPLHAIITPTAAASAASSSDKQQECEETLQSAIERCLLNFTADYKRFAQRRHGLHQSAGVVIDSNSWTTTELDAICNRYGDSLMCLHIAFLECTPVLRHLDYMQRHLPDPDVMLPTCYPDRATPSRRINQTATHSRTRHITTQDNDNTPSARDITTQTTVDRRTQQKPSDSSVKLPWQPRQHNDVKKAPHIDQDESSAETGNTYKWLPEAELDSKPHKTPQRMHTGHDDTDANHDVKLAVDEQSSGAASARSNSMQSLISDVITNITSSSVHRQSKVYGSMQDNLAASNTGQLTHSVTFIVIAFAFTKLI